MKDSPLAFGSRAALLLGGLLPGLLLGGLAVLIFGPRAGPLQETPPPASSATTTVDDSVVATVDREPITGASLGKEMTRRQRLVPGLFDAPEARRALLDERIRFETLVARARAAGYERESELVEEWKRLLVRRYEAEHLEPRIAALSVSNAEIARHYEAHRADYVRPERRRVALMFLSLPDGTSPARRRAVHDRAEALLAEARGTADAPPVDFAELARRHSDHRASRYVGGDVGWVSRGQRSHRFAPSVVEAMFALDTPGALSPVVRGPDGLYVLKLTALEAEQPRPLEELRPRIRHTLLDAKRAQLVEAFHAELASRTRVEIDPDALDALRVPEEIVSADRARQAPPGLPGG